LPTFFYGAPGQFPPGAYYYGAGVMGFGTPPGSSSWIDDLDPILTIEELTERYKTPYDKLLVAAYFALGTKYGGMSPVRLEMDELRRETTDVETGLTVKMGIGARIKVSIPGVELYVAALPWDPASGATLAQWLDDIVETVMYRVFVLLEEAEDDE
jgi:hypothetical protein